VNNQTEEHNYTFCGIDAILCARISNPMCSNMLPDWCPNSHLPWCPNPTTVVSLSLHTRCRPKLSWHYPVPLQCKGMILMNKKKLK